MISLETLFLSAVLFLFIVMVYGLGIMQVISQTINTL